MYTQQVCGKGEEGEYWPIVSWRLPAGATFLFFLHSSLIYLVNNWMIVTKLCIIYFSSVMVHFEYLIYLRQRFSKCTVNQGGPAGLSTSRV